ncbi:transcriptional regulator BetI [Paracoccus homiensis]|uniref:transcriptional regulator BetI n=1 Tax=Paracoccus homiensis TaxID=364199 RepID=UPI00398CC504
MKTDSTPCGTGPKYSRKTADERREALLQAALRCIVRLGVEKSSIRAIADEAGVSVGLINHHYGSKEALVAAAYRHVADDLLSQIESRVAACDGGPRERLSAFIDASFSPVVLNETLFRAWLAFWTLQAQSPEVSAVHKERYGAYRQVLEKLFAQIKGDAEAGAMSPRMAAIGLSGLLDGLWLEWCLEPETFTPAEGIALAERWVETAIDDPGGL